MASPIPRHYHSLTIHLSDPSLVPIHTSLPRTSSPSDRATALAVVQASSLVAYTSTSRLGLGLPQRIMVESASDGPVLLHSFLDPRAGRDQAGIEAGRDDEDDAGDAATQYDANEGLMGIVSSTRDGLRNVSGTGSAQSNGEHRGSDHENLAGMSRQNARSGGVNGTSTRKGKAMESTHLHTELASNLTEPVEEPEPPPPLLLATVIAPDVGHAGEARRALVQLERFGLDFQREWSRDVEGRLRDNAVNGSNS